MSSVIETGHAKIVANFDRLIESVIKLGKDYNPSNPSLIVEALQKASVASRHSIDAVGSATIAFRTASKDRDKAFASINKLVTRIYNTIKASDTAGSSNETARLYVRKIQGIRSRAKRSDAQVKADNDSGIRYKEVSASQMSFDSRIENFGMLVKLVSSIPSYKPNETDLKSESLAAFHEMLKQKNSAVVSASSTLFKARALRNEILYKDAMGITDIAMDAKSYLKGAFGYNSPQYKEVSGLKFKKIGLN